MCSTTRMFYTFILSESNRERAAWTSKVVGDIFFFSYAFKKTFRARSNRPVGSIRLPIVGRCVSH